MYNLKMKTNKIQKDKTIQQYRRDIYALKTKLKTEEQYLEQLRQKYANSQILTDKSYTFSMKLKILEYTLNDIRSKLAKFAQQEAYQYYCLNFATFALVKSCEVIGMTRQMIFRGIDAQCKGQVGWFQFSNFLREVMRLDSEFINPIMKALSTDESKPIKRQRYDLFLASFLLKSEQNGEQIDNLQQSLLRIARELIKQNIEISSLWNQKEVNVAHVVYSLMSKVTSLDVLDCVACYCRCDPVKTGIINTSAVFALLKHKINDVQNFSNGKKIKLSKD